LIDHQINLLNSFNFIEFYFFSSIYFNSLSKFLDKEIERRRPNGIFIF